MFFSLPEEIIRYIYEFDNTYHEIFKNVLKDIEILQIYKFKNLYYIYNKEEEILYLTDNLKIPSFISTSYMIQLPYFKNIIRMKKLVRINEKLEFDIKNFLFTEDNELRYL